MQIPTFPTDSLYKFMAISGTTLLLFVLSVVLFADYAKEIAEVHHRSDLNRHDASFYALDIQLKELSNIVASPAITPPRTFSSATEKKSFLEELNVNLRKNDDIASKLTVLKLELIEAGRKRDVAVAPFKALERRGVFLGFLAAFATLQMFVGFTLWYLRIQRLQDRKLQQEANKQPTRLTMRDKARRVGN